MAAARPTWQGHLRLSLVTCPVALYTATDASSDVRFNMLHKKTHNRIRMVPTDPDLGPIERADIVKGYEVSKGEYVVVTQDEIDSVRLESTRTIDIERFVSADEIDRLYWDNPYFLVPDGKLAAEAYGVIREAMTKEGQVALGRVVMHQRERLLAIEPRDAGMVAWSLRSHDEVRDAADYFDAIKGGKPDAAWTPEQVVHFMLARIEAGDFYILCPDNDVTRAVDEKRMAWAMGDIIDNRPALSRWHPDWKDAFAAFMDKS